jgi:hypothetical protein
MSGSASQARHVGRAGVRVGVRVSIRFRQPLASTPSQHHLVDALRARITGVAPIDRERNFIASLMRTGASRANATRSSSSSSGGGSGAATDADEGLDADAAVAAAAAIAAAGAPVCAPPAVLCANLKPAASSPLKGKVAPYAIFERSGEKIGVVGLDTVCRAQVSLEPQASREPCLGLTCSASLGFERDLRGIPTHERDLRAAYQGSLATPGSLC